MVDLEIITIVKNDNNGLYKTYKSIKKYFNNQNISWLIIDGSDYLQNYKFDGIKFKIINQNGFGIYNAMNLGIENSSGKYCIFLNAGDEFINNLSLDYISKYRNVDVFCFSYLQIFLRCTRRKKVKNHKFKFLNLLAMPTSHQAMIFKGKKLRESKFDEFFKICGDYAFYLCSLNKKWNYRLEDQYLIAFKMDGISSTKHFLLFKESCISIFKYMRANYLLKIFSSLIIFIRICLRYVFIILN